MPRAILQQMVDKCPTCNGTGKVKVWDALGGGTYRQKWNEEKGEFEYEMKPCPYCQKARKFLALAERE